MGAMGEPAPRKPLNELGNLELEGNLAPATTSLACSCKPGRGRGRGEEEGERRMEESELGRVREEGGKSRTYDGVNHWERVKSDERGTFQLIVEDATRLGRTSPKGDGRLGQVRATDSRSKNALGTMIPWADRQGGVSQSSLFRNLRSTYLRCREPCRTSEGGDERVSSSSTFDSERELTS